MSTKTLRPPPRRLTWPNNAPAATTTTKTDINKRKEEEERNGHDFQRPKKPHTTGPNPNPSPMTRLPNFDKLRKAVRSDPNKKQQQKTGSSSKPTNGNNNEKEKEKEMGLKGNNQLMAGYMAHEYLTKGTILGRRWDHLPSHRAAEPRRKEEEEYERYVELSSLVKTGGAHFSGIVNPTQLARYLRLPK